MQIHIAELRPRQREADLRGEGLRSVVSCANAESRKSSSKGLTHENSFQCYTCLLRDIYPRDHYTNWTLNQLSFT